MTFGAVCAGGLVALGAVLDFLYSAEEKARLRVLLEATLYRFRYVTPRSFGREEMTFAIGLLERVFGSRFWSWRRWIGVSLVSLMAFAYAVLVVWPKLENGYVYSLMMLLITTVGTALSVSLSIWLSRFALGVPGGTSLVGILCLLAVHITLFVFWRPIVESAQLVVGGLIHHLGLASPKDYPRVLWLDLLELIDAPLSWGRSPTLGENTEPRINVNEYLVTAASTSLVSLFAGSLRLLLSAWFVIAVVYVRIVRPLIIRAWTAFIQPDKAFFSIPFGTLAAGIGFFDNFSRIYGAVTRLFA
jgi:hypothetical protein